MDEFRATDQDGDSFTVMNAGDEAYPDGLYVQVDETAERAGAYLTRQQALELYEALGDHLAATALDAGMGEAAEPIVLDVQRTILEDAQAAVYGDRQADYGHPREDFTRTAIIWTGLLQPLLADGAYIDAADVARCQIGVKLARDVHAPKRDNRVDMAGYALTLDRLETGR